MKTFNKFNHINHSWFEARHLVTLHFLCSGTDGFLKTHWSLLINRCYTSQTVLQARGPRCWIHTDCLLSALLGQTYLEIRIVWVDWVTPGTCYQEISWTSIKFRLYTSHLIYVPVWDVIEAHVLASTNSLVKPQLGIRHANQKQYE